MTYPQRPTTQELRRKEHENRLRRKQSLLGLIVFCVGTICLFFTDTSLGLIFCSLGAYTILTESTFKTE